MTSLSFLAALIVSLLQWSGPAAIPWSVGTIVVDAIQRHAGIWAAPHVAQEGREIVPPLVAHGDAATAPSRIVVVVFAVATPLSSLPRSPLFRRPSDRRLSVSDLRSTDALVSQTPATLGESGPERGKKHDALAATIAGTPPSRVSTDAPKALNGNESSESLSSEIQSQRAEVQSSGKRVRHGGLAKSEVLANGLVRPSIGGQLAKNSDVIWCYQACWHTPILPINHVFFNGVD